MTTYNLTKNDTPKFISCSKKGTPKNGTSRTSIYGSYPPPGKETDDSQTETVNEVKAWQREENTDFYGGVEVREDVREIDTIERQEKEGANGNGVYDLNFIEQKQNCVKTNEKRDNKRICQNKEWIEKVAARSPKILTHNHGMISTLRNWSMR